MRFEVKKISENSINDCELDLIAARAKRVGINIQYDKESNQMELSLTALKNISYRLVTCGEIRKQMQYKEKKDIIIGLNMSRDTFYRTLRAMENEQWPDNSFFSILYHQKG